MVGAIWQVDGPPNAARVAVFGSASNLDATTSNHQAPEASVTLDFALSPELADLRERATKVAAEGVAEYGVHHDCWINGFSRKFSQRLAAEGWIGMTWPVEHGGGGRPEIERLVVAEAMISAGAPIAASWFVDRQMGPTMFKFGTPDQQQRFLPGMLRGDETWSIGMSEPDAGSDLASVATSLVRDGDVYVVNGQKIWTSFASDADYVYLIARTSREGPPHQGLSELIVPLNLPGIDIRPVTDMIGNRHFCEVFFNNVRVTAANLVGVEGGAFAQTMGQLEHERGGIDRVVSNRPLFDIAMAHADLDDPLVRQEIAAIETGYRIGRLLVYRAAVGQAPAGSAAMTKCIGTEHEQRVADFAARVLGPHAMASDDLWRAIGYAPAYTIQGGTSDIMRNIIGERTLGLPREPRAKTAAGG